MCRYATCMWLSTLLTATPVPPLRYFRDLRTSPIKNTQCMQFRNVSFSTPTIIFPQNTRRNTNLDMISRIIYTFKGRSTCFIVCPELLQDYPGAGTWVWTLFDVNVWSQVTRSLWLTDAILDFALEWRHGESMGVLRNYEIDKPRGSSLCLK